MGFKQKSTGGLVFFYFGFCLQDIESTSVSEKSHFRNELILANNAVECAVCAAAASEEQLIEYKNKYAASSRGTSSSGSAGTGMREETLRSTPPTGTVNDLIILANLTKLPEQVYTELETREDWADLKQRVQTMLAPIRDLTREIKSRTNSFEVRKSKRKGQPKQAAAPTVRDGQINVCVASLSVLCI